ncbi:NUDIX hydrolase [Chitinimonas sp. BJB300]|uniref:NUDIX hydrolase n=1 Tax=Chitinimonas sp. BJB300 TaxID=1559339 RepID=UPI000C113AC9|nr:NUDIX hydrolase [Chitinimonas sp. BJB300]PHV12274.1 NUDIX hydrolase [Chitinimonas sp. BJB300]TSJ84774.1 NUDIX hydrolase [Chitinimonas sp. BJB300]
MSAPIWKPNTTVAAVVEHQGLFLLVEEETEAGLRFNQPAGHLDADESLLLACVRETREETAYLVKPTALVGIYQWSPPTKPGLTYLRFAYAAEVKVEGNPMLGVTVNNVALAAIQSDGMTMARLDKGIVRAVWLSYEEVLACRYRHRSPLVLQCIEDYRAGRRFPLDLIRHYD